MLPEVLNRLVRAREPAEPLQDRSVDAFFRFFSFWLFLHVFVYSFRSVPYRFVPVPCRFRTVSYPFSTPLRRRQNAAHFAGLLSVGCLLVACLLSACGHFVFMVLSVPAFFRVAV